MGCLWFHMAATSMIMQRLASYLVIKPLTFLCFDIFVPLTYLVPTASCAANMHVSVYLFTSSAVTCESLASQLCLLTALTLGRFVSFFVLFCPFLFFVFFCPFLSFCLFVFLSFFVFFFVFFVFFCPFFFFVFFVLLCPLLCPFFVLSVCP